MNFSNQHVRCHPADEDLMALMPTSGHEVLLIGPDSAVAATVLEAAAEIQRPVQLARTTREGFRALFQQHASVDVVIVDLESTIHGLALVEAIDGYHDKPPVMALIGPEQCWMAPIARLNRTRVCVIKPVSSHKLAQTMGNVVSHRQLLAKNGRSDGTSDSLNNKRRKANR